MRRRGCDSGLNREIGSAGRGAWLLVLSAITTYGGLASAHLHGRGAKWTNVGPWGGQVGCLAVTPSSPGTIYAGTWYAGVYKSRDRAGTWQIARGGIPKAMTVQSLVLDPYDERTLYAGTLDNFGREFTGVFRSDDSGTSWKKLAPLPRGELYPRCIGLHPANPRIMFVGGYSGVYGSRDGGESWTDLSKTLPTDPSITALVVDPSNPQVIYAGTQFDGVFRTADDGQSWTPVNNGQPKWITALAIDPSDTSVLYAATWRSGLYKSHDAGQSWKAINDGIFSWHPRSIALDPTNPRRVYVGCWGGGVYMTTTGGE